MILLKIKTSSATGFYQDFIFMLVEMHAHTTGGTCTVGKKQFHFHSCVVAKVQEVAISFSFTHFQTVSRSIFFFGKLFWLLYRFW